MSETSNSQPHTPESGSFQGFSSPPAARAAVLGVAGAEIDPPRDVAAGDIAAEIFPKELLRDCEAFLQNNEKKIGSHLLDATEQAIYRAVLEDNDYVPPTYQGQNPKKKQQWASLKHNIRNNYRIGKHGVILRYDKTTDEYLPQACTYDAARYVAEAHMALGHAGIKKTFDYLLTIAVGIPRKIVEILLRHCLICMPQRANQTRAPLRPIYVERVLERLQIDLMDFK